MLRLHHNTEKEPNMDPLSFNDESTTKMIF